MKDKTLAYMAAVLLLMVACDPSAYRRDQKREIVRLITLNPGHFHAALVQKSMYQGVDSVVHVYAPAGGDLELHLQRIEAYNHRSDNPTQWQEKAYRGDDFLQKMLSEKKGNVVVIAGKNQQATEYIQQSLEAGLHVLADKPMAIDTADFERLKQSFATATTRQRLLYDIMTERYEITSQLQRDLAQIPEIFGTLEKGTPDNPAVVMHSVHHFYKLVSGQVLRRPAWFLDVAQQGEGIVDVATHLVDLVQWECFPNQAIDYSRDIQVDRARHWPTEIRLGRFKTLTGEKTFPEYLKPYLVRDTVLQVFANGEINYRIRDVHAKVSVAWNYQAPQGGSDTHFSLMRGSKANLIIRQGSAQQYKAVLYIEPLNFGNAQYMEKVTEHIRVLEEKYPGLALTKNRSGWEVVIPDQYREGHEAHFARVMEHYLDYLAQGRLPEWEVPNMLAKYYVTTQALELARAKAQ